MRGAASLLTLVTAALLGGCGGSAQEAISVFPADGTRTASPSTQLSFRGADREALGDVTVEGSRSGRHRGRWRAHPDGRGASFAPAEPFRPGERVTVRLEREVAGAGRRRSEFTVAGVPAGKRGPVAPAPRGKLRGVTAFRSRPDLRPPALDVTTPARDPELGAVFVAPKVGLSQKGPMIVAPDGELVWFHPLAGTDQAFDFRAQRYRGKPVLTWWEGPLADFHGRGVGRIYDTAYRPVATVRAGNGYSADLHELELTPRGTAWIAIYEAVPWDLRSRGGKRDGTVYDQIVQEVDVRTGAVLFEWHSMGEVGLDESYQPLPDKPGVIYDPVHINSVAEQPDGSILVSARHTHAVYAIDRKTGKIRWRLGGKRSSFDEGGEKLFAWQHDARRRADGAITLYDNAANGAKPGRESRGLVIRLDEEKKTARIEQELTATPPVLGPTQGNLQNLPGGNSLVGWGGTSPRLTQFDRAGRTVFDARLRSPGSESYRAYRMPWRATPAERPAVAVRSARGRTTAYASWNGATEVARWRLLGGPDADRLRPLGEIRRSGFETALRVRGDAARLAVEALDEQGRALARSETIPVR